MKTKLIVFLVTGISLALLYKPITGLFEWDIKLLSSTKQWAKIIAVKDIEVDISVPVNGRGSVDLGSYTNWLATVRIKNKEVKVRVLSSPAPKIGQCLPVLVKEFTKGIIIASLDVDKWRFELPQEQCE